MITDTFDISTKEIITPNHFVEKQDDFPAFFISSFSRSMTKVLTRDYDPERIGTIHIGSSIPIYAFNYEGTRFGYLESPVGAPAAVMAEEFLFAMGTSCILYCGSCGYLDPSLKEGFFIPTACYRDDGTSYHYAPPSDILNVHSSDRLKTAFNSLGISFNSGMTWTTDGFFRETLHTADKMRALGIKTVEMECASLMAASDFRKKNVYQFFYPTDYLESSYNPEMLIRLPDGFHERIIKLAILLAMNILED